MNTPQDPLASRLWATLFFGGIFLVAFVVNLVLWLFGLRPGGVGADPSGARMVFGWLAFAVGSGVSVAAARRRSTRRRNLTTGVLVGFFYAAACLLTFGPGLRLGIGAAALAVGTWSAVAWAVTSALSELLPDPPLPPR